jgi:hypothetical protein
MCVAGERLKPQRSPTRKRWLPVFPHFNQRATCVPAAQRMRSECAADVGVKTTLMDWGGRGSNNEGTPKKRFCAFYFFLVEYSSSVRIS